jgi:hypothetical protein
VTTQTVAVMWVIGALKQPAKVNTPAPGPLRKTK